MLPYMHKNQKDASEKVLKAVVKAGIEPRLFTTTLVKKNTAIVYPWFWQEECS